VLIFPDLQVADRPAPLQLIAQHLHIRIDCHALAFSGGAS
jgi:hypothetical protein